jgi:hypothetical protein
MNHFIEEVKLAQTVLARRGGIFESHGAGIKLDEDRKKDLTHRDCTNQWRTAKLGCLKGVESLEKLRDKHPDEVEKWGLDEALNIWELKREGCCRVPGYRYDDKEMPKIEKRDEVKEEVAPEVKQEPTPEPSPKEDEPADDGWEVVKRKWKKRRQPCGLNLTDETEQNDPDEAILREMKALTDRLENSKLSSKNHFGALAEHGDTPTWRSVKAKRQRKKVQASDTTPAKKSPSPPSTPVVWKSDQEAAPDTPKSILKRRTTTSPKPGRSVRITDEAMILPSDGAPVIKKPHSKHAFAETRRRQAFYRRGTWNKPGPWASPPGYEKANTSHRNTGWLTFERIQKEAGRRRPPPKGAPDPSESNSSFSFSKGAQAQDVQKHVTGSSSLDAIQNGDFKSQWKMWFEEAEKNKASSNAWMNGRGKVLRAPKKETPRDGAAEEKMNKAVAEYEKNVGELAKAADEWEKASAVKKWTEPESER